MCISFFFGGKALHSWAPEGPRARERRRRRNIKKKKTRSNIIVIDENIMYPARFRRLGDTIIAALLFRINFFLSTI